MLPLFGWYAAKTTNVADDPVFVVVACLLIGFGFFPSFSAAKDIDVVSFLAS